MTAGGWSVVHRTGSAAAFHALEVPDPVRPEVWWFEVSAPALVLGSTQPWEVADRAAAAAAGAEVVRRRSGGGAVHLAPGAITWVDVILPADDPRWEPDVGRSFAWLGRAWVRALASLGVEGAVSHDGPMVRAPWSELVCFAGLGPGEVTVGGAKVVGMSQRRTRAAARFQCGVVHRWAPGDLVALLALDEGRRREAAAALDPAARGIGAVGSAPVVEALVAALDRTGP